jgi:hypothetical protein
MGDTRHARVPRFESHIFQKATMQNRLEAVEAYQTAKRTVLAAGSYSEIQWQDSRLPTELSESEFLRELAWVVLCSGFRESTVRSRFESISLCFCDWESAYSILSSYEACRRTALRCLNHPKKIDAILAAASTIFLTGFEGIRARVLADPIEALQIFDYIGEVTSLHLAKNLGFDVAKPDRHLVRIALSLNFDSPQRLCEVISEQTGDRIGTVDLILWRYAALIGTR